MPSSCTRTWVAPVPSPGQTDITSGAVPEGRRVRICCWYWSAPLVV
ncbi:hypothetical protein STENM327S_00218 [Streptomyces tendae]